ncbi:hypothetical protein ACYJ1Y_11970 [Natrialbaceae archaeon A-gly3]
MSGDPIEGQVLLLTAAKASVPASRLPDLLECVQGDLEGRLERYRREYECFLETDERRVFLVEWGHWDEIADRLELNQREVSAVRRAHEEQLRRMSRRDGTREEVEATLEIRDPVVIATPD